MQKFTTYLQVRHYEMDSLGHVNNAVYQHYLEHAAIEHSEAMGFTLKSYQELGGLFVLRKISIDYLYPAYAGDTLEITTWLAEMRGTRLIRRYEIHRSQPESQPSQLILTAEALWVWIDQMSLRPKPIPKVLISALEQYLGLKVNP